jgi:hypothetical protein
MKFETVSIAAMLLIIGMMSAMPMASAEEQQIATLYKVTLLKDGETYDMGEITLPRDFLSDGVQIPVGPGPGPTVLIIEKIKDMLSGSELRAINTVGVITEVKDMNHLGVQYGINSESDGQYYLTGPYVWIDTSNGDYNGDYIWVCYGYQPNPGVVL